MMVNKSWLLVMVLLYAHPVFSNPEDKYIDSSHIVQFGAHAGWMPLSSKIRQDTFEKILKNNDNEGKFRMEDILGENRQISPSIWNFIAGGHAQYTYYFNQKYGVDLLSRCGYTRFASYTVVSTKKDKKPQQPNNLDPNKIKTNKDKPKSKAPDRFTYGGVYIDTLIGFAINFNEDGLFFEEGDQLGTRIVTHFYGGVRFDLSKFSITGDKSFLLKHNESNYSRDRCSTLIRILVEPAVEFVPTCGLVITLSTTFCFLGPWKATKFKEEEKDANDLQQRDISNLPSIIPMLTIAWDLGQLTNW